MWCSDVGDLPPFPQEFWGSSQNAVPSAYLRQLDAFAGRFVVDKEARASRKAGQELSKVNKLRIHLREKAQATRRDAQNESAGPSSNKICIEPDATAVGPQTVSNAQNRSVLGKRKKKLALSLF